MNLKMFPKITLKLTFFTSALSFAAGYEKAAIWSAHSSALGNAVSANISGADALYFNPAGLSNGSQGTGDLSLNFSPTYSQFKGPINGSTLTSTRTMSPVVAALFSYKLKENFGIGIGYYVSGGTKASYENIAFTAPFTITPNVSTELAITETAVGFGYKVNPSWSLGAAWRVAMINASLAKPTVSGSGASAVLVGLSLNDLSATNFNGVKAGVQYHPEGKTWALGLSFRSALSFEATGTTGGTAQAAAAPALPLTVSSNAVSIKNQFPMQVGLGFFDVCSEKWNWAAEYTWTQYSKNKIIDITGSTTITGGSSDIPVALDSTDITQNWFDQHNLRFGVEYKGIEKIPLRYGYVLTSQVTNRFAAGPTFSSPGLGHTFVLGSGYQISDKVKTDLAVEYSKASGKGMDSILGETTYSTNAWVVHASLGYTF